MSSRSGRRVREEFDEKKEFGGVAVLYSRSSKSFRYDRQDSRHNHGFILSSQRVSFVNNSFTVVVRDSDIASLIAFGVAPSNYPRDQYVGWRKNSIGYHLDDGGLFAATGHAISSHEPGGTGDVFHVVVNYDMVENRPNLFRVSRNGREVCALPFPPRFDASDLRICLTLGDIKHQGSAPSVRVCWGQLDTLPFCDTNLPASTQPQPALQTRFAAVENGIWTSTLPHCIVNNPFGYIRSALQLSPQVYLLLFAR